MQSECAFNRSQVFSKEAVLEKQEKRREKRRAERREEKRRKRRKEKKGKKRKAYRKVSGSTGRAGIQDTGVGIVLSPKVDREREGKCKYHFLW